MKQVLFILLLVVVGSSLSRAQRAGIDSILTAAETSFNSGLYENAELIARRLLESRGLQDSDRISCERIIAFSLIAQGKPQSAQDHFISILSINSSFELDPVLTSPKILSVFTETKRQFALTKSSDSTQRTVHDPFRSAITYRALLFPGWEQIHSGRSTTGMTFMSVGILSLGSGVAAEFLRSSARKLYLSASSPSDIADKYKIYNRYYHLEAYSFIVFGLTYIGSEVELFSNGAQAVEVHAAVGPKSSSNLTFSLRF